MHTLIGDITISHNTDAWKAVVPLYDTRLAGVRSDRTGAPAVLYAYGSTPAAAVEALTLELGEIVLAAELAADSVVGDVNILHVRPSDRA